jgi:hypothetical protein
VNAYLMRDLILDKMSTAKHGYECFLNSHRI